MTECSLCGKRTKSPHEYPYHCNYCGKWFCAGHRLPEEHNCPDVTKSWPFYWREVDGRKRGKKELKRVGLSHLYHPTKNVWDDGKSWFDGKVWHDKKELTSQALSQLETQALSQLETVQKKRVRKKNLRAKIRSFFRR